MSIAVAREPVRKWTLIICWKGGAVSSKSKFIFYAKFWLQKIHSKAKKTVASLLKFGYKIKYFIIFHISSCATSIANRKSLFLQRNNYNYMQELYGKTQCLVLGRNSKYFKPSPRHGLFIDWKFLFLHLGYADHIILTWTKQNEESLFFRRILYFLDSEKVSSIGKWTANSTTVISVLKFFVAWN